VSLRSGTPFGNPCKLDALLANVVVALQSLPKHGKNEIDIWDRKLFTSYTHPVSWLTRQDSHNKNFSPIAQEKRTFLGDKNFSFSGIFS
jgi:hypothetical protein